MLGEFEISQMLRDIEEASPKPRSVIQTESERILEILAAQNALILILDWTPKRQEKWNKFIGKC